MSEDRKYKTEDFDLVDLYICYNPIEAEFIREVLDENDIAVFLRDMHPSQFPMNVGKHAQVRIVVEDDKAREAMELIQQALEDGAITGEGKFIFDD